MKIFNSFIHQDIGGKQNISLTGDQQHHKKWLILETLSKRRPLAFQIDDFLSPEECEHIKKLAMNLGKFLFPYTHIQKYGTKNRKKFILNTLYHQATTKADVEG